MLKLIFLLTIFYFSFTLSYLFPSSSNLIINKNNNFNANLFKSYARKTKNIKEVGEKEDLSGFTIIGPAEPENSNKKSSSSSSRSSNLDKEYEGKQEVLKNLLTSIDRSYGKGTIQKLSEANRVEIETFSTGSTSLDMALGGGLPKGRVIEIYGPEASGKTTLALHAIAEIQKFNGTAAFIDAEHALDPVYAKRIGVNVKDLLICQPDSGEMALDVLDQLVRSSAIDLIVIDSVAALVPRVELEGDMGEQQVGLQARLMSKALRKLTGSLSKSKTTVIFLNQLRSKIGVLYGNPEVTSGGNALKFYSSVRIDIRRKEIINKSSMLVKIKIVKNKIFIPFQTIELEILLGQGINKSLCLFNTALYYNIIEKKGSWYYYNNIQLNQGKTNCVSMLKDKNLYFKDLIKNDSNNNENNKDNNNINIIDNNNDENLSLGEEIEKKVREFMLKKKNGIITSDNDKDEYNEEENDEYINEYNENE